MFITNSHQYVKIYGYSLSDICISCGQCPHVRGEKNSLGLGLTLNTDHHLHFPLALKIVSEYMSDQAVVVRDNLATPIQLYGYPSKPQCSS